MNRQEVPRPIFAVLLVIKTSARWPTELSRTKRPWLAGRHDTPPEDMIWSIEWQITNILERNQTRWDVTSGSLGRHLFLAKSLVEKYSTIESTKKKGHRDKIFFLASHVFFLTLIIPPLNVTFVFPFSSPASDLAARRGVFSRRHYGSVEMVSANYLSRKWQYKFQERF